MEKWKKSPGDKEIIMWWLRLKDEKNKIVNLLIDTGTSKTFIKGSNNKKNLTFKGVDNISKDNLIIKNPIDYNKQQSNIIGADNISTWSWIFVNYDTFELYIKT